MKKAQFASFVWSILVLAGTASAVVAQAPTLANQLPSSRAVAMRSDLETKMVEIDQILASPGYSGRLKAAKRKEADQIRRRLREGDFQTGDQIVLAVVGETIATDTFTVTSARSILIPAVAEIPLSGVLRSELTGYMTQQLGRFFRQPNVITKAFIRLAVFGEVGQPGFYQLPADEQLGRAIMLAGGPTAATKLSASKVMRGEAELWAGDGFNEALTNGTTLDQFNLQAGDEIRIGKGRAAFWGNARSVIIVVSSAASLALLAARTF